MMGKGRGKQSAKFLLLSFRRIKRIGGRNLSYIRRSGDGRLYVDEDEFSCGDRQMVVTTPSARADAAQGRVVGG